MTRPGGPAALAWSFYSFSREERKRGMKGKQVSRLNTARVCSLVHGAFSGCHHPQRLLMLPVNSWGS